MPSQQTSIRQKDRTCGILSIPLQIARMLTITIHDTALRIAAS